MSLRIVAIVGSRSWRDANAVAAEVKRELAAGAVVATGCARSGVDFMVRQACKDLGTKAKIYWAAWRSYGDAAGPIRNRLLADACDEMIVFRSAGKSNGTDSVIYWARRFGRPLTVHREDGTVTVEEVKVSRHGP